MTALWTRTTAGSVGAASAVRGAISKLPAMILEMHGGNRTADHKRAHRDSIVDNMGARPEYFIELGALVLQCLLSPGGYTASNNSEFGRYAPALGLIGSFMASEEHNTTSGRQLKGVAPRGLRYSPYRAASGRPAAAISRRGALVFGVNEALLSTALITLRPEETQDKVGERKLKARLPGSIHNERFIVRPLVDGGRTAEYPSF